LPLPDCQWEFGLSIVTETEYEVITRFPVAGAQYFTVNRPLSTVRETEAKPSQRAIELVEASATAYGMGVHCRDAYVRSRATNAMASGASEASRVPMVSPEFERCKPEPRLPRGNFSSQGIRSW
jgi:hypothetical protein